MATPKVSSFHLESVVVELYSLEEVANDFIEDVARSMDAGSTQAFRNKCATFIEQGQLQLLVEAFLQAMVLAGPRSSPEDMESRFSIIFSLARHLPSDVLAAVAPQVTSCVLRLPSPGEAGKKRDLAMRLEVLRRLYCVVEPRSALRFELLSSILSFSTDSRLFGVLDGTSANDVEELCGMWFGPGATAELEPKRKLYKALSDLGTLKLSLGGLSPEEVRSEELKQHRFLHKLMETYETSPELLPSATAYAARCALIAIKYPLPGDIAVANSIEELSLEGLKKSAAAVLAAEQTAKNQDWASLTAAPSAVAHFAAIKFLSSVSEHAELYKLLQVFAAHGLKELLELNKQSPKLIANLKLNPETCTRNMRFLTLASLAASAETVAYATIATQLQCPESDVERWVIDAITCKVIDAKLDQATGQIVINRGSQRLLTDKQWGEVKDKLGGWKKNVRALLTTIKSVRQEHIVMQQQMLQQQGMVTPQMPVQ